LGHGNAKEGVRQANGHKVITGGYWLKMISHQLTDDLSKEMKAIAKLQK